MKWSKIWTLERIKEVHFRQIVVLTAVWTHIGIIIELVQLCYYELERTFQAEPTLHSLQDPLNNKD
jgi:hypothetical protein